MKVKAPFYIESIQPRRGLIFRCLYSFRLEHCWNHYAWGYFHAGDLPSVDTRRPKKVSRQQQKELRVTR